MTQPALFDDLDAQRAPVAELVHETARDAPKPVRTLNFGSSGHCGGYRAWTGDETESSVRAAFRRLYGVEPESATPTVSRWPIWLVGPIPSAEVEQ